MKCDIDGVINSHAPKDNRDPDYYISNTLNNFKLIRKGEGRHYIKGEMMNRIIYYANTYGKSIAEEKRKVNYSREGFYGIFARRLLRKMRKYENY